MERWVVSGMSVSERAQPASASIHQAGGGETRGVSQQNHSSMV